VMEHGGHGAGAVRLQVDPVYAVIGDEGVRHRDPASFGPALMIMAVPPATGATEPHP
jgi:hypothetical protein